MAAIQSFVPISIQFSDEGSEFAWRYQPQQQREDSAQ
jgi:hypothetical protein